MNYYNQAFRDAVKADPSFIPTIEAAADSLSGVAAMPSFDVLYFPKSDKNKFGTAHVFARGFDLTTKVMAVIVQLGKGAPTTGTGSLADLTAMIHWAGIFNADHPDTPSLLSSVLHNNIVLIFVQTTEQSNYLSGETDFAYQQAQSYNLVGKPGAILCSLGGFGFLQSIKTPDDAAKYFRAVFVAPGGNGNVGAQFPAAAAGGKLECLFYHNYTDPIALVAQSIKMHDGIVAAGGKSNFVVWDNVMRFDDVMRVNDDRPVHDVTFALNAFFPPIGWPSYNSTDHKLRAGSYVPVESIYSFLCADQGEAAPVPDKELGKMELVFGKNGDEQELATIEVVLVQEQGEGGRYYIRIDDKVEMYFEKP